MTYEEILEQRARNDQYLREPDTFVLPETEEEQIKLALDLALAVDQTTSPEAMDTILAQFSKSIQFFFIQTMLHRGQFDVFGKLKWSTEPYVQEILRMKS